MAKFNYKAIRESIANTLNGSKRVETIMKKKFEEHKQALLLDFENHPVTREIKEGGTNISNTLGGYGNLRGFIGFDIAADPISPIKTVLQEELVLIKTKTELQKDAIRYKFSVRVPEESLKRVSPLPWEGGKSWLFGIETGISGFGNFLFGRFNHPKPSRSGEGIQIATEVPGRATFKKTKYLRALIKDFVEKIK